MADFSSGFMGGMQQLQQIDAGNLANRQAQQNMQYLAQSHAQEMANQQAQAQVMQQLSQQRQQKQQQATQQAGAAKQQQDAGQQRQMIVSDMSLAPGSRADLMFAAADQLTADGKYQAAAPLFKLATEMQEKAAIASQHLATARKLEVDTAREKLDGAAGHFKLYVDSPEGWEQAKAEFFANPEHSDPQIRKIVDQPYRKGIGDQMSTIAMKASERIKMDHDKAVEAEKAAQDRAKNRIEQQKANADTVKANAYKEHVDSLKKNGAGVPQEPIDQKYGKLSPVEQETLDTQSWNWINTKQLPYRKGAGSNDKNQTVMLNAGRIGHNLGMTAEELSSKSAVFKADASAAMQVTKDLSMIKPYKEMLDLNGDVAIQLSKKILSTNSQAANKGINWVKSNFGSDPNLREYLFQVEAMQNESARVLSNPRLVGQMPLGAKQDLEAVYNGSMPVADAERVIRRMQKDGQFRVEQLEKQRSELVGSLQGGGRKPTDTMPKAAPGLPQEAVSSLKEGTHTTFKNGQTWTLKDGKPEQVKE